MAGGPAPSGTGGMFSAGSQKAFTSQLKKVYTWYTGGFLVFVVFALAILEQMGLPRNWIGYVFLLATLLLYAGIGVMSRTSDAAEYYVAGRRVPAVFNGMATGADWMSAASFIGMAGTLYLTGYGGLAFIMGWTGGYCLVALFLAPYLRKFSQFTIPDFLGERYGGNIVRTIGIISAITCSALSDALKSAIGRPLYCPYRGAQDAITVLFQLTGYKDIIKKTSLTDADTAFSDIDRWCDNCGRNLTNRIIKTPAVAWTKDDAPLYSGSGIVNKHTYSLLGVVGKQVGGIWTEKYIVLRNPFGKASGDPTGSVSLSKAAIMWCSTYINLADLTDGIFAIRADDFFKYFAGYAWTPV